MVPVNSGRTVRNSTVRSSGHVTCGFVGFVLVVGLFLAGYSAITALADGTFGVLSSTAIVWLFIIAWLGLWLAMELVLVGWTLWRAAG